MKFGQNTNVVASDVLVIFCAGITSNLLLYYEFVELGKVELEQLLKIKYFCSHQRQRL